MNKTPRKTLVIEVSLEELMDRSGISDPWQIRLYLKSLARNQDIQSIKVKKGLATITVFADTELMFMLAELGNINNGQV